MADFDWNAAANRAAEEAGNTMFEAHRGAIPWRMRGVSVAFGNDGYGQDDRTKREVVNLRDRLAEAGIPELGFGLCPEEYSWALIVRTDDVAALHQMVWEAGAEASHGNSVQYSLATTKVMDFELDGLRPSMN